MVIGGLACGLTRGALSWLLLAEGIDNDRAAHGLLLLEIEVVKGAIVGAVCGALIGWTAGWIWEQAHRAWRRAHPPRYT